MPLTIVVVAKSAVALIACLVVADIVGAVACTVFDVVLFRFGSAALAYAVWLVIGVFCGLFAYNAAGAWTLRGAEDPSGWTVHKDAYRIGNIIVATSAAVLLALTIFFRRIYWSQGVDGEYYVPDSAPHTLVFFVAAFGAIASAQFMLAPRRKQARLP